MPMWPCLGWSCPHKLSRPLGGWSLYGSQDPESHWMVPFHNDFPLAVSSLNNVNQLIQTVIEQYFPNITIIQNVGLLWQIRLDKIYCEILLICQNTTMRVYGAWIKRYCVSCSKTYSSSNGLLITSRWFTTSRLGAPASVRLVYIVTTVTGLNYATGLKR